MSTAGKNHRSVIDFDSHYNNRQMRFDWNSIFNSLDKLCPERTN